MEDLEDVLWNFESLQFFLFDYYGSNEMWIQESWWEPSARVVVVTISIACQSHSIVDHYEMVQEPL